MTLSYICLLILSQVMNRLHAQSVEIGDAVHGLGSKKPEEIGAGAILFVTETAGDAQCNRWLRLEGRGSAERWLHFDEQRVEALTPTEAHEALAEEQGGACAVPQLLLASLRAGGRDCAECSRRQKRLSASWEDGTRWAPPASAHREGGFWSRTADEIATLRTASKAGAPDGAPAPAERARDFRHLYASFPKEAVNGSGDSKGGDCNDGGSDIGNGGPRLSAQVPRIASQQGGSSLPEEASRLLAAGMCCVLLEASHLWPAAADRWADATFLRRELAEASCAVLSAPVGRKRFSYWLPHRRFQTLAEARKRGMDRVFGRYAFDEPQVKQLNLSVRNGAPSNRRHAASHPTQSIYCVYTAWSAARDQDRPTSRDGCHVPDATRVCRSLRLTNSCGWGRGAAARSASTCNISWSRRGGSGR